jgi:RNA polymerase sigma-70 factor (ECF subfamily)
MAEYGHVSDSELVRASVGDPAAFEVLFERHAARLRGWLVRETHDLALANDLVAETFAQAWRSRRRFAGSEETAGAAWLYGIARNLLKQHYKRGRVEASARRRLGMSTQAPQSDDLDALLERLDAAAQASALDAALEEVSEPQRRAIERRIIHGHDYDEIARDLRTSPATARAHVSRGLRSLHLILKGARQ